MCSLYFPKNKLKIKGTHLEVVPFPGVREKLELAVVGPQQGFVDFPSFSTHLIL
jgi:hypothetical protein